ncbi:universal stress protein [Actinomadura latina]|uniref:Universal stress protein n=1 Tax=Actinomadura latina TaxID=163603 RepID=A0A846ZBM3_9ACTN|nr:universal stress protein [Actinomadura latina]NKZ08048.1 universal stress protein [Actinomadura latina]
MSEQPVTGVLVGYDGSEGSARALEWAAEDARRRGAPLTVLHSWDVRAGGLAAMPAIDPRAAAQDILNAGIERAQEVAADLKVRAVLARAPAAARLIEASGTAELIVLGPRGTGGFAGLTLGSVGAQVAAYASCPVVIVRGDPDQGPQQGPGRVVVGMDGSPASRAALALAFAEADAHGLSLRALVAWDPLPGKELPPLVDEAGLRAAAEARLARLMAPLRERHPGVEAEIEVVTGVPRKVLMDAAGEARLLVVGSRGVGGFRGLLLGSVSHALVHHAPVPVAVVHASAESEAGRPA